jgi:predicted metalloprotease with PDZ domain
LRFVKCRTDVQKGVFFIAFDSEVYKIFYMKIIINVVLLIFAFSVYSNEPTIKYSIFCHSDKLDVELFFQQGAELVSDFLLPQSLEKIEQFESPSHQLTTEEDQIRLNVRGNEPVILRYSYKMDDEDFFKADGEDFFVIPDLNLDKNIPIQLEWQEIPPDWILANSYGIQMHCQEINTLNALHQGVYIGGKFSLVSYKDGIHIISQNKSLPFDQIHGFLQVIMQEHQKFWNDFRRTDYLVIISSSQEDRIDAYSKYNAFMIHCKDLNTASEKDWCRIVWVFSHEYFHNWNPYSALPAFRAHFDELAWFIEGFTDYYATLLLYKAGILSFDQCVEETYSHLEAYYASPFRNMTNSEFVQNRHKDPEVQFLPYQQGYALALLWDDQIRSASNGQASLDDLMLSLFQAKLENITPFEIGNFAKHYMGDTAVSDIERYILKGETIPASPTLYGHPICLS